MRKIGLALEINFPNKTNAGEWYSTKSIIKKIINTSMESMGNEGANRLKLSLFVMFL